MTFNPQIIQNNLDKTLQRIKNACEKTGRDPAEVNLMAVTKTHPAEAVEGIRRLGVDLLGENRVQEAAEKRVQLAEDPGWELIGHLQRNKARQAIELFRRIQSVDRLSLLNRLNNLAEELQRSPYPILLQVNAGADPNKFGAELDEAEALLEAALASSHLQVDGFMTIAPLSDDPDVARRCFANLREFRDRVADRYQRDFTVLSMGMSGDLEAAIAEGSTLVRIGSALFGDR
ncbi:MAG: YggS family pyridoxal phosphate-dependent enzyme [Opitutales bacterium]|nr:YggS family pyridoxal phosphate-dependent enzyme [Opitutales bacterium]